MGSAINRQGKGTRKLGYGGVGRLSPRWVVPIRQATVPAPTPHKGADRHRAKLVLPDGPPPGQQSGGGRLVNGGLRIIVAMLSYWGNGGGGKLPVLTRLTSRLAARGLALDPTRTGCPQHLKP